MGTERSGNQSSPWENLRFKWDWHWTALCEGSLIDQNQNGADMEVQRTGG